jgi:hypothetical protein
VVTVSLLIHGLSWLLCPMKNIRGQVFTIN